MQQIRYIYLMYLDDQTNSVGRPELKMSTFLPSGFGDENDVVNPFSNKVAAADGFLSS